ncbi:hypothetical protein C9374_003164 [Naegleria lovaniensis]|uniref:T4 RNA ligase 1-like N-terminal domain-containing protein n=1 Tax=Naegleria lovaniensis TaxID=51637 RepID=A0AA88GNJ5_NAELO|nr:uncharacterized protein C9374_003164 [Naegleria lovaniensis]KAG2386015.1 hypothetical protein C9374_003164 [Naegleria lovaniensis]
MFPTIKTYTDIHECLFAIIGGNDENYSRANEDEFTIRKEQGYIFIKYKSATRNTFPDPEKARDEHERLISKLRRECRGIIFDEESKEIVCRKFHKFFNINEREETNVEKINWKRGFRVLEKMDGSLVSPVPVQKRASSEEQLGFKFTTMLGFTEVAQLVDDYVFSEMKERQRKSYISFCKYCIEKEWTPLFEFCSPKQTIVIEYTESSLTLLAIRKNESGEYVEFNEMVKLIKNTFSNDIPIVKVWKEFQQGLNGDPKNLLKEIYSQQQVEGYVIRFNDGDMYKVKTHWYNSLHGVETSGKSVRDRHIILGILDNTVDDLIASAFFAESDHKRNAIQFFRDEVERKLEKQISVMKKELQHDCSPDSVTGQFSNFVTDQSYSPEVISTTEGRELFNTFLKERFKLNSREFDKHRKLFYKWLCVDFSGMKPFFFTEQGILMDPKAEKSVAANTGKDKSSQTNIKKKK